MFKRKTVAATLIMVLVLVITPSWTQAAPSEPELVELTLDRCLELAAENNPQLKLAAVALDQAQLGLKETKSGVRKLEEAEKELEAIKTMPPEMLAEMGLDPSSLVLPSDLETTFFKDQGVWMAEEQVALAQAGHDLAGEGVRLAVISAYYDFLQGEADLKTGLAAEKEAEEARRAAAAQLKVGMATPAQDLAAEVGLAGAQAARLGAESALEAKRLALLREIGLGSEAKIALSPPPEREIDFELEQVLQAALESSLEIKGAQFRFEVAEKKFDLTSKWYPDITYKYKGAECEYLEAQIQLLDTRLAVETGVRSSYKMQLAAKGQLAPAQRAVEQAAAELRTVEAKFKVGAATELDLLTAKRALAQAESSRLGTEKNYALATASLEAAEKGLTAGLASLAPGDGGATPDARAQG